jgi:hypothetical protein
MVGVDYGLRVERAELADARSLNRFLPSPSIMALESGRAFLSADIATSGPARTAGGQIDLSLADGGIRLHQTHLAGDFALTVIAHGYDSQRAVADLEGSHLAMRNVRVTGASTDTSAWSGDLMLESGTLDLGSTPGVEGDLTLHARDASPILGVLFRDSLPHFVAQLTDMPSLTAVAHLTVDPENIAISDLFVTGGDLALRGTYVAHEADRRAVFVVQKGPFSAGVSVDGDGAHVRLFGLDGWYASSQQALLQR